MPDLNQPQPQDAVLGGILPPVAGVVLGGITGIQQQFASEATGQRLQAVLQAARYGQAGLDLLIQALQDPSLQVQKAAYWQLKQHPEPMAQKALRKYEVYRLLECVCTLRGHQGGITAVAISPDGKTIVSAGRDQTLRVWDIEFQEELMTIPEKKFVYGIAVSPDNRMFTVKTGERSFKAWDMRTEQEIEVFELPTRGIASVTFSSSRFHRGKYLISGSQRLVRIWNLSKGREICVLQGHTSLVTAVAAAPNQPLLVSGSEDKTIRVWGLKEA